MQSSCLQTETYGIEEIKFLFSCFHLSLNLKIATSKAVGVFLKTYSQICLSLFRQNHEKLLWTCYFRLNVDTDQFFLVFLFVDIFFVKCQIIRRLKLKPNFVGISKHLKLKGKQEIIINSIV